jgi:hypothetical protein
VGVKEGSDDGIKEGMTHGTCLCYVDCEVMGTAGSLEMGM